MDKAYRKTAWLMKKRHIKFNTKHHSFWNTWKSRATSLGIQGKASKNKSEFDSNLEILEEDNDNEIVLRK